MATPNKELDPHAAPESAAPEPMFDSLEEERAYHQQKAEQFKNRLNQQVTDIKADTTARVKTGLIWTGAFLASYGLVRLISGSKKHIVQTSDGPTRISEKESVIWSAVKGAALLGLGVVAKDQALAYMAKRKEQQATHEYEPYLGPDTTEL